VTERASKPASPAGKIFVGVAGWSYPDWGGIVYPAHRSREFDEASYLADYFDTIEINTSFYQPPRPAVAERWVERLAAHPRFLFTAKLWQKFTHETGATGADAVNALQLIHLLTEAKVRLPEPLRHRYPELEAIADAPAEEPTLFPNPPR
jgi:uncharacterized protein YecE (DUF72 family)